MSATTEIKETGIETAWNLVQHDRLRLMGKLNGLVAIETIIAHPFNDWPRQYGAAIKRIQNEMHNKELDLVMDYVINRTLDDNIKLIVYARKV